MSEDTHPPLRVVCVCGQRMKISSKMFGLPGKCVACRQKITIPKLEDIPEGSDEFRLDEHTEYLRGPRVGDRYKAKEDSAQAALNRIPSAKHVDGEPTPITELDLPDEGNVEKKIKPDGPKKPRSDRKRSGATIPLDLLDPKRIIISLHSKLAEERMRLVKSSGSDENLIAEIDGNLARIDKVHEELNEKLRQLLMETAIELSGTQEKLNQARLDSRVSDLSLAAYQEAVHKLRSRRDRLEHRQLNLRGWLALRDPFLSGGYLDLSMDALPEDGFSVNIPAEPEDDQPLLNLQTQGLRDAMRMRANSERKLAEARSIRNEAKAAQRESANRVVADIKAEQRRVQAQIVFYQERLQQLVKDFGEDLDTISAQLDSARDRLRIGEMSRGDFDALEADLLHAKTDVTKARSLAKRALVANSSLDVPEARGTFLQRLGFAPENEPPNPTERGLIGVAAFLFVLSLILENTIGRYSLINASREYSEAGWLILLPVACAALAAAGWFLPNQALRGRAWLVLWTAIMVVGFALLRQGITGTSPLAFAFQSGPAAWFGPGIISIFLGGIALFAAGAYSAYRAQSPLYWAPAALVTTIVAIGFIGILTGEEAPPNAPSVSVVPGNASRGEDAVPVTITMVNQDDRRLFISGQASNNGNTYYLSLEKHGDADWSPVHSLLTAQTGLQEAIPVEPGEKKIINLHLEPGEYRLELLSSSLERKGLNSFNVTGFQEPQSSELSPPPSPRESDPFPENTPPFEVSTTTNQEEEMEPVETVVEAAVPQSNAPQVELKGILTMNDGSPRFSIVLYLPNQGAQRYMLGIGESVYGDWSLEEYNALHRTVTLNDGRNILTIRRGEKHALIL